MTGEGEERQSYPGYLFLLGWLLLSGSSYPQAGNRVGILSHTEPFISDSLGHGVLADEVALLWQGTAHAPALFSCRSRDEALKALTQGNIQSLITAETFNAASLKESEPLMSFHLCLLGRQSVKQPLLVLPEVPLSLRGKFSNHAQKLLNGDNTLYANLRRLIRGEASGIVAPCFMVNQFMLRVPLPGIPHSVLPALLPVSYRAWVLPVNLAVRDEINRRISRLYKQDVRRLEQHWKLPIDSVTDQRPRMGSSLTGPLALRIALVSGPPPLVITDEKDNISDVWRDLLDNFFPTSIFSLHLMRVAEKEQAELLLKQGCVDLIMGVHSPLTGRYQGVIFDYQVPGLVSQRTNPLKGDLPSLRHKRLAVVRSALLTAMLRQSLTAEGLLQVDNIIQGLALIEAGR